MDQFGDYRDTSFTTHHYAHPYAPRGEPSQPLRSSYVHQPGRFELDAGDNTQDHSRPFRISTTPLGNSNSAIHGPIPAPVVRSTYAEPVFQTFQERKRAREAHDGSRGVGSSRLVPAKLPSQSTHGVESQPTSNLEHTTRRALPRSEVPPSSHAYNHHSNSALAAATDDDHLSQRATHHTNMSTPSDSPRSSRRPLPSPTTSSQRSHPAIHSATSRIVHSPVPVLDRSDTVSSVKSLDRESGFGSPTKRPLPKPPVAVSSSKSLDRGIPSGVVAMSTSTLSKWTDGPRNSTGRRLPSTVTEVSEGSDDGISMDLNAIRLNGLPPSPQRSSSESGDHVIATPSGDISIVDRFIRPDSGTRLPTFSVTPSAVEEAQTQIRSPSISFGPSNPATFTPLPAIVIGDTDDNDLDTPNAGIIFGGLPVIAVSSCDTADGVSIQGPDLHARESQASSSRDITRQLESVPLPTRIEPSAAIICAGCRDPIIGRIVSAMNQRWHPQCFRCGECGEHLEHVSSYEFNGKPYCHLDYHDKFAHRCHHCKTPIVEPRFITLDDPVLGQRYYHELHFFCSECGDPFLDPSKSSAPGTELSKTQENDEEETSAFVIQKGHPYCERCHLRLHKPKCKGCRLPIPDIAIEAMNGKWHQECFVCLECGNGFANNLFFPRDGKAYCTECYSVSIGH